MTYNPVLALISAALVCTLGMASSPAANAQTKDEAKVEEPAKKDEPVARKITDRSHPDYMRCRSEPVIGSLVRKRRVCMKNSEWEEYARAGNEGSRTMIEDISQGGMRQD